MKFKRYEYVMKGSIEWCEEDIGDPETESWDEFKKKLTEDNFFDNLYDQSAKDIIEHNKDFFVVRVVEGQYIDGKEVITKTTEKRLSL